MDDRAIIDLYWERSERAIGESGKKYGRLLPLILLIWMGQLKVKSDLLLGQEEVLENPVISA